MNLNMKLQITLSNIYIFLNKMWSRADEIPHVRSQKIIAFSYTKMIFNTLTLWKLLQ